MKGAVVLAGLVCACACLQACGPKENPGTPAQKRASVVFPDGWVVQVDLAVTENEHARGLMFVKELPPERGMLFLFGRAEVRPFWMKDCFIPLDMIWLDGNNRVVDITAEAPPCPGDPCPNYYPKAPAINVLEVQGGLAAAHNLAAGDVLVFVDVPPSKPGS